MKFTKFTLLLIATVVSVTANPVPIPNSIASIRPAEGKLYSKDYVNTGTSFVKARLIDPIYSLFQKRANNVPGFFIVANEDFRRYRVYSQDELNRAIDNAVDRLNSGQLTPPFGIANRQYPHPYYDYDRRIHSDVNTGGANTEEMYEFPLVASAATTGTQLYSGGYPGMDRVIFDRDRNFITVIGHETRRNSVHFIAGYAAQRNSFNTNQLVLADDDVIGNNRVWRQNRGAGGLLFGAGYAFGDKVVQFWPRR
ncbi:hypothetical protein BJ170DRAFT_730885 [Xylariales sp. AK1849]|nr:hypothetical protein BJ170DRAFT_730885 [Xylariales sp. AK1849]